MQVSLGFAPADHARQKKGLRPPWEVGLARTMLSSAGKPPGRINPRRYVRFLSRICDSGGKSIQNLDHLRPSCDPSRASSVSAQGRVLVALAALPIRALTSCREEFGRSWSPEAFFLLVDTALATLVWIGRSRGYATGRRRLQSTDCGRFRSADGGHLFRTDRCDRGDVGRHSKNQQPSSKTWAVPIRAGPESRERITGLASDDSDVGLSFLFRGASRYRCNPYERH